MISPNAGSNLGTQFPNDGSGFFGAGSNVGGGFNFDPRLQIGGSSLGFTPGVTPGNQFFPGSGSGFFFTPYGFGNSGPMFNSVGPWAAQNNSGVGIMRGGIPIAGLNSPPLRPGPYRWVNVRDGGSGSGYEYQSRARADELAQQGESATISVRVADPEQARVAVRMENLMENRPLTQGTIVGPKEGALVVRYEKDGQSRINRFDRSTVFFFGSGGRLAAANAASLPSGTEVLVPLPTTQEYQQAVAGSRQEMRAKATIKAKAKNNTR